MEAKRRFTDAEISSALEMVEAVYMDACAKCIADVCDSRELEIRQSRKAHMFVQRKSWEGPALPSQIKEIQEALDASLVRWLSSLRARAEAALRL